MSQEIFEGVRDVIVDKIGVSHSEVTPTSRLVEDLGADSLITTEIVMDLEDRFNIEIPDEDAESITTVQGIVVYIAKKL